MPSLPPPPPPLHLPPLYQIIILSSQLFALLIHLSISFYHIESLSRFTSSIHSLFLSTIEPYLMFTVRKKCTQDDPSAQSLQHCHPLQIPTQPGQIPIRRTKYFNTNSFNTKWSLLINKVLLYFTTWLLLSEFINPAKIIKQVR